MWEKLKNSKRSTRVGILAIIVVIFAVMIATGGDDDVAEETSTEPVESEPTETDEAIKEKVEEIASDAYGTELNEIEVVANKADDSAGGYNVLAHLVFDVQNTASTAKETIISTTDSVGAKLAGTEGIENITFFWEVPYLHEGDNVAKINAEHRDGNMVKTDEWFDGRIFETDGNNNESNANQEALPVSNQGNEHIDEIAFQDFSISLRSIEVYKENGGAFADLSFRWLNHSSSGEKKLMQMTGMDVEQGDNLLEEVNDAWTDQQSDIHIPNAEQGEWGVDLTYQLEDAETPLEITFVPMSDEDSKQLSIDIN